MPSSANDFEVRPLSPETWDEYEKLILRHNGVWGGCWCIWFHCKPKSYKRGVEENRAFKKQKVQEGKAQASLVFDKDVCVAWCQFGPPSELTNIYHKKEVEAKFSTPDWRITCFFVDKKYRRKGVSALALKGAIQMIKSLGGGLVESYPQDTDGKKVSSSFLFNATRQIFEREGFSYEGKKGKNHCTMRLTV